MSRGRRRDAGARAGGRPPPGPQGSADSDGATHVVTCDHVGDELGRDVARLDHVHDRRRRPSRWRRTSRPGPSGRASPSGRRGCSRWGGGIGWATLSGTGMASRSGAGRGRQRGRPTPCSASARRSWRSHLTRLPTLPERAAPRASARRGRPPAPQAGRHRRVARERAPERRGLQRGPVGERPAPRRRPRASSRPARLRPACAALPAAQGEQQVLQRDADRAGLHAGAAQRRGVRRARPPRAGSWRAAA